MIHFIFPGDPETPTGGFAYGREMVREMRAAGVEVEVVVLPGPYPYPQGDAVTQAERLIAGIPDGAAVIYDALAAGVMPDAVRTLAARSTVTILLHHPLADEGNLAPQMEKRLFDSETASLAAAHRVIVSSQFTAHRLADFGVTEDRLTVIEPGIPKRAISTGSNSLDQDLPVRLLAVASVTPRKAYTDLLSALLPLRHLPWRLECIGGFFDPNYEKKILAAAEPFGQQVAFRGSMTSDALDAEYARADIFVSASHYEGYGMAIAEAVICGIPTIAASGGAVPLTAGGRAAHLYPPGDIDALSDGLRLYITDREARAGLRDICLAARDHFPTWAEGARRMATLVHGAS